MFVALGKKHTMLMCYIVICGLPSSIIFFPNYLINFMIFGKSTFLNIKVHFDFLYNFFYTFFILRRSAQDMIKNVIGLYVKYALFLSEFNES